MHGSSGHQHLTGLVCTGRCCGIWAGPVGLADVISYADRAGILLGLDSSAAAGEVQVNGG